MIGYYTKYRYKKKKTVFDGKVDGLGRTFLKSRNIIKIATTKKKSKN